MARIDDAAAREEVRKAAECSAQAEQLLNIAQELQKAARAHLHEADELRGVPHRVKR